jgi:hypothetical protein
MVHFLIEVDTTLIYMMVAKVRSGGMKRKSVGNRKKMKMQSSKTHMQDALPFAPKQ